MFCTKCGAKNEDGALFCMQCGNKLTAPEPELKELVEEPVEEVVAPRRRESNTNRRGAYAKPKRSKAPLVIAIAVVAVVAVVVMIIAGNSGSSSTSAPATETSEVETIDISGILSDLQQAFVEETQVSVYFVSYESDEEYAYGDLYIYKDQESFDEGDEYIEYYNVNSKGTIYDLVGNVISLDDFYVRDEVLEALQEEKLDAELTAALPYSEDIAWVQYIVEDGNTITSTIDKNGNLLFTIKDIEVRYCSPFSGGMAYYSADIAGSPTETIVDADGNELYHTGDNLPDSVTEERIVGLNDGEFLALRHFSGMQDDYYYYALIDSSGNETQKYSAKIEGASCFSKFVYEIEDGYAKTYVGDGVWFIEDGYKTYNLYISFTAGTGDYAGDGVVGLNQYYEPRCDTYNGLFLVGGVDCYFVLDTSLNAVYKFDDTSYHGGLAKDGEVCIDEGYYSYDGTEILKFSKYPELNVQAYPFYDDFAVIEIDGVDEKTYVTCINRNAEELFEPIKMEWFSDRVIEGYLMVGDEDGNVSLIDMTGKTVHDVSKDVELFGGEVSGIHDYYEDGVILEYSKEGSKTSYYLYYNFLKYATTSSVTGQSSAS